MAKRTVIDIQKDRHTYIDVYRSNTQVQVITHLVTNSLLETIGMGYIDEKLVLQAVASIMVEKYIQVGEHTLNLSVDLDEIIAQVLRLLTDPVKFKTDMQIAVYKQLPLESSKLVLNGNIVPTIYKPFDIFENVDIRFHDSMDKDLVIGGSIPLQDTKTLNLSIAWGENTLIQSRLIITDKLKIQDKLEKLCQLQYTGGASSHIVVFKTPTINLESIVYRYLRDMNNSNVSTFDNETLDDLYYMYLT